MLAVDGMPADRREGQESEYPGRAVGHAEVGVPAGSGVQRVRVAGCPPAGYLDAVQGQRPGHDRGQVGEDVAEGVAGRGGAQQDGADPGEPVEQVVLAERARLAARDPGAGGGEPLAGDAVHVPAEDGWASR